MREFKRSRLEKKEDEEITKKTVLLGLITLLIFVGLVIFGLPILIRLSVILGEARTNRNKEVQEKVIPPPSPRIVLTYEATNSAKININGLSEKGLSIELMENDVSLSKTQANELGEFMFEEVNLDDGNNLFSVVAFSEQGVSSEPSKVVDVIYDNQPPELVMVNPSEEKVTIDYADFDIVGKTEKGASVMVNNRVAMMDDEGKFKIKLQLNSGKNQVEIVIKDLAGNESRRNIEITYDI